MISTYPMTQLAQQVARRLTLFYVVALTVIAVLTSSGLLFIRHTIKNLNDDGRVLNVAGRQRMLSQRLTKLALIRIGGVPATDTISSDRLLTTWSKTHTELRNGVLHMEKAYVVRKSKRLDSMFVQIEPTFQAIFQGFVRIYQQGSTVSEQKKALQVILREEPAYLQQMDDIVFQFDAESFARVKYLERVELFLSLATLLTLFIEGMFIFRPVVRHTQRIIRQLSESEEALRMSNSQLETANHRLVVTQTELLRTTEEKYELQRAEDTIRSAALLEGQEEERRRFARELHDGIGQMLTGLKLHAENLKKIQFTEEKHRQRFEELCGLIQETIQTTRQVSYNLMPSVLSDFGLAATLQLLAEQTARSSGIPVLFEGKSSEKRLSPVVDIGLYRIAQEALHNAVKYAQAECIVIKLQQEKTQIRLQVEDNGKGFILNNLRREHKIGSGIENMRTRARLLNGDLSILSKPNKGTKIIMKLDLGR